MTHDEVRLSSHPFNGQASCIELWNWGSLHRELAERHGVHRRTVRQALASAVPPPRKTLPATTLPTLSCIVTASL